MNEFLYKADRHPVDEALGCMVPAVISLSLAGFLGYTMANNIFKFFLNLASSF